MIKNWQRCFISTALMAFSGAFNSAQAQVILNEIMPAPSSGPEWIELFNAGPEPVALSGWRLEDQLSQPSLLHTFTDEVLEPTEFLVIEVTSKLNNSGDGVSLFDADGLLQDTFQYESSQSDQSWALVTLPNGNTTWQLAAPTPGQANPSPPPPSPTPSPNPSPSPTISPSPIPSSSPLATPTPLPPILVTEIMACPASGESEWVEIENAGATPVTLTNWKIVDSAGNTRTVSNTIPSHGYGLLAWSGSLLNNAGDSVQLKTPDGILMTEIVFDACQANQSFIFQAGQWQLTTSPTPGAANLFTSDDFSQTNEATGAVATAQTATSASQQSGTVFYKASSSTLLADSTVASARPYPGFWPSLDYQSATTEPLTDSLAQTLHIKSSSPDLRVFRSFLVGGGLLTTLGAWQLYRIDQKISADQKVEDPFLSHQSSPHLLQ